MNVVINLKNLVETIENILGKKAILNHLPMQQGDVNKTYADISKAKKEIGYDTKYDIETGLIKFIDWYNLNKNTLYGDK